MKKIFRLYYCLKGFRLFIFFTMFKWIDCFENKDLYLLDKILIKTGLQSIY